MKKMAALVIFLLVTLVSVSVAEQRNCDICNTIHSVKFCPEACRFDCVLNQKDIAHKWHECPERVIGPCLYCGEETVTHNEQCCPSGPISWNDFEGCFTTEEFPFKEWIFLPEYCEYCEYYGYHSTQECLNRPEEDAPILSGHEHSLNSRVKKDVKKVGSSDICEWETTKTTTFCEECRLIISLKKEHNATRHSFEDNVCIKCGYDNPIVFETISILPRGTECDHAKTKWVSDWSKIEYDNKEYCHTTIQKREVCDFCGEDIRIYTREELKKHVFNEEGLCECGYVKRKFFGIQF